MKISIQKFKAILVYFANNTDTRYLGKTKLMKLFYFLDFNHLKKYGSPVTYDRYVHLQHGPIPQSIKNLIDESCDDPDNSILADAISFEKPESYHMDRILPNRKFTENDKNYFSKTEIETIIEVCSMFGNKNTKYIEDASHEESPWLETSMLEDIPYTLATNDTNCKVDKDEIDLLNKIIQC